MLTLGLAVEATLWTIEQRIDLGGLVVSVDS